MTNNIQKTISLDDIDPRLLLGVDNSHSDLIEKELDVEIVSRGVWINIKGDAENVLQAEKVVKDIIDHIKATGELNDRYILYSIAIVRENGMPPSREIDIESGLIISAVTQKLIKPKTVGQKNYIDLIENKDIVFSIGPAGTGKTYLAVAMAVRAFKTKQVARIVLTRPAVEAGENLGFLPGDIRAKVDPYLRPLYDALADMMAFDKVKKLMELGVIEIAPLAFMRGRTLNNAFVILDEAQNTTSAQMLMFLTRLGEGSRAVITGDITQIDLDNRKASGLLPAKKIMGHIEGIGFISLTEKDIVRHKLVQDIIKAYAKISQPLKGPEGKSVGRR
ncbi:MAG: phosphate starvation-inducible protein PhoH [candidate division Zixibacteria bacterium RBG_16_53_22]|nr:MAG: phosphate starvation-inducible protein PhoH [candidate division Zixibacteria bacterium RBG_16_53_22]